MPNDSTAPDTTGATLDVKVQAAAAIAIGDIAAPGKPASRPTKTPAMRLRRVNREQLRAFIGEYHRHTDPPKQSIVKVGVAVADELVAVGCGANPVSRLLDDGETIEISRVCCKPGKWPNACSMIYGALCRAAKAQGFSRAVTYTLATEPGTSPGAAGFERVAESNPDSWQRKRAQVPMFGAPSWSGVARHRWEKSL